MTSVTAYLCVDGASDAIDFYTSAFGAKERYRVPMPDGTVGHADLAIGDTTILLADEWSDGVVLSPLKRGGVSATYCLQVDSIDELDRTWTNALEAGATVDQERSDQFYGFRSGTVVDPFGHRWEIMTQIEDVSPEELQRRVGAMNG